MALSAKNVIALGTSSGITQLVACIMQVTMNNSLVYYGNKSAVGGDVALSASGDRHEACHDPGICLYRHWYRLPDDLRI